MNILNKMENFFKTEQIKDELDKIILHLVKIENNQNGRAREKEAEHAFAFLLSERMNIPEK